jgi:hypothetical protein
MSQATYQRLNTDEQNTEQTNIELSNIEDQSQPSQSNPSNQPSQSEQSSQPNQAQSRRREKLKYQFLLAIHIICSIFWFYMFWNFFANCERLTGVENQCTGWTARDFDEQPSINKAYINCATSKFDQCANNNCSLCIESYGGFYQCVEAKYACNRDSIHLFNFIFIALLLALSLVQTYRIWKILKTEFTD